MKVTPVCMKVSDNISWQVMRVNEGVSNGEPGL